MRCTEPGSTLTDKLLAATTRNSYNMKQINNLHTYTSPAKRREERSIFEPLRDNQNLSGVLIRRRPTHRPAQVDRPYLRSKQAGADRAFAPAPTSA